MFSVIIDLSRAKLKKLKYIMVLELKERGTMMAAISDLINQIEDSILKERIKQELSRITSNKKFGLVFEEHFPECTPLYNVVINEGSIVARKDKVIKDLYLVDKIEGEEAFCINRISREEEIFQVEELVVVSQFGEPIFPMLMPIDKVKNNDIDNAPWHVLIEADNFHALQLLEYTHAQKIDCIYIDPPYNTGSKDWKYNNDYVDKNDNWRHSKWLAFMKRRLKVAKQLLNPEDSVLILAIDDNELFTIGMLLDEIFLGCERQIINITINPKGKAREGRLSQVDEYLIVVYIGEAKALELPLKNTATEVRWPYLRRSDIESARGTKKGGTSQFYPIYVNEKNNKIVHLGPALGPEDSIENVETIEGAIAVFPIKEDGTHMNWGLTAPTLQGLINGGFVRVLKSTNKFQAYNFSYLTTTSVSKVKSGIYKIIGTREDGSHIVVMPDGQYKKLPTVWNKNLYDANTYGTQLLGEFVKDRKFPFPKSLYSVYDAIRAFIKEKPNAFVLDFFSGSGTTMHAVNLLNAEDNGKRRCIMITNNEVSEEEAKNLQKKGIKPGDYEWEQEGICRSITWPRIKYSTLGISSNNTKIEGEYHTSVKKYKSVKRNFYHLNFITPENLDSLSKKKNLVGLIGKKVLPQSLVKKDSNYIVSKDHTTTILFDELYFVEWLEQLKNNTHIKDIYIICSSTKMYTEFKTTIESHLGELEEETPFMIPMNIGFKENIEYFKLDFLDKNNVELGRNFKEILPILWMKSGAIGNRPEISSNEMPPYMIFNNCKFAILLDESHYYYFYDAISNNRDIEYIYLVTNSEEAFNVMASNFSSDKELIQLYRDYIDNFYINGRG
ncbi:modification methylase [Lysinibacillus fusiformis ZB2]|nr:modification methylase [Lysinibacillus fusiformis ZB2]